MYFSHLVLLLATQHLWGAGEALSELARHIWSPKWICIIFKYSKALDTHELAKPSLSFFWFLCKSDWSFLFPNVSNLWGFTYRALLLRGDSSLLHSVHNKCTEVPSRLLAWCHPIRVSTPNLLSAFLYMYLCVCHFSIPLLP